MSSPDVRIKSLASAISAEYAGELTTVVDENGRLVVAVAGEKIFDAHKLHMGRVRE